jgi:hypothetical protein
MPVPNLVTVIKDVFYIQSHFYIPILLWKLKEVILLPHFIYQVLYNSLVKFYGYSGFIILLLYLPWI